MIFKIKYNQDTTLIEGNYSSSINYPSIVIDEEAKTIDGSPYIEITDQEHQDNLGKTMCVINGVYQEYVKPDDILLQEAKDAKIAEIKTRRDKENMGNMTAPASCTAPLLIIGNTGLELEGSDVNFVFRMSPTANSFTNPVTILTEIITQDSVTNYSTKKVSDGSNIYVRIDKTIASKIKDHAKTRTINNIFFANEVEKGINNCSTIEEVEAITWGNYIL